MALVSTCCRPTTTNHRPHRHRIRVGGGAGDEQPLSRQQRESILTLVQGPFEPSMAAGHSRLSATAARSNSKSALSFTAACSRSLPAPSSTGSPTAWSTLSRGVPTKYLAAPRCNDANEDRGHRRHRRQRRRSARCRPGRRATVGDAIDAAGFSSQPAAIAIFGELVTRQRLLQPDDRVELLRELIVDPMEARRRRAERE